VGLADLEDVFEFSLPTHATEWQPPASQQNGKPETGNLNQANPIQVSGLSSQVSNFSWDSTGCRTDCSWFGFKIAVKPGAPFSRTDLARELDRNQIGNRMLFGGNLLRQPAFVQLRADRPEALRVVGEMEGSDQIMTSTLFLGTYPGLTEAMLMQEIKVISNFLAGSHDEGNVA
jgi:CDP-6-deoxy-D-xylo-4-hexulose-3-dehydrase